MQGARALFEAGRLTDAVHELTEQVRSRPADAGLRTFLFELLCFQGDLDRARKQLGVMATQISDPGIELAVQVYEQLLAAEGTRRDVFHGDALPKFVTPPGEHVERYLILLRKMTAPAAEVAALLEQAEEASPEIGGERKGQRFSSLRDADDRVAGVLEVFHGTDYLWVPFDQITRLEIEVPTKLRELMWARARLQVADQPEGEVFIPALYVDSYRHEQETVRLGRSTEWEAWQDQMVIGSGQRVFLVDGQDVSLFDLGDVGFAATAQDQPRV
jgi:type VI secretion system protein ImpE